MPTHWGKTLYPLLCGAFFLLSFSQRVIAVPAAPVLHSLTQPDGTVIKARQWGDENLHGWETDDGFTIVRDDGLNRWTYAERAADGRLISTARVAGKDKLPAGLSKRIRPRGSALQKIEMKRLSRELQQQSLTPQGLSDASLQFVVSPSGTGNIPVILINFSNRTTSYTAPDFNTLLFGTGNFSMKDFYTEVSYGAFSVSAGPGGVVGWYTAADNHDYYGYLNGYNRAAGLVKEAVMAADAAGFNFAPYDQDGDCYVDVVNIVHQGAGAEASGDNNDIWSHRWNLSSSGNGIYTTNDNCSANPSVKVKVNDYVIQPEMLWGSQQTMGVFAHEYGHVLGLPDLYDTDNSSEGIGDWSLMAGGSWNGVTRSGDRPAHPDAWCKYYLGWVTPTEVMAPLTDEPISQASTSPDIYKLRSGSPLTGEYFLVENRQKTGFDAGLPGAGLLIWHIDGNTIASKMFSNSVNNYECYPGGPNCSTDHYGVKLVQADNLWEMEKYLNSRGNAGDAFKSAGNATFDGTSSPNSNFYNGSASNISVTNISGSGPTMHATLQSSQPTVQFQSATSSGSEATTPAVITVTLSAASGQTVMVNYATANGTASAGSDYTATSGTLTFNPGQTSRTINVPITNDSIVEGNETFTVNLSLPFNATLGTTTTYTYTILNDDFAGTLQFSASNYSVNENGGTVTITATRTGGSSGTVGVSYATSNGTAISGTDYTATSGTLSWAAGDTANRTFTVSITNDALDEQNETFSVTLSNPTGGATLGATITATVTITDDDAAPTVQFQSATLSGSEATTPAVITVTLSAASGQTVMVNYATANGTATAGNDYASTSGTLTFNPGDTSKTINVPITNDSSVEGNETFTVNLSSPSKASLGAKVIHTYTISDDDSYGSIELSSSGYSVGENGTSVLITATRTGGSSGTVGVSYATAGGTAFSGTDYTATSGTLSWAAGDTANKTFNVLITNDTMNEANETFTVTLSAPTGGAVLGSPNTATVTITDDDAAPTVQFQSATSSGSEATTPAVITVTLSAASGQTVTVNYATANGTASVGSDYTATSGTLTFNPGDTSKTINVPITNDSVVEVDETFMVNLSLPFNATLGTTTTYTYTILNDDFAGTLQFSASNYSVNENGGTVTITATRTGGSSGTVGVSYATLNGTAISGTDYTATSGTLSWANGDAANKTFAVSITNDVLDEQNETFSVTLSNPTGGATLGTTITATVTITDDDPVPTVQFQSATSSGGEATTPAVITVTLSAVSGQAVTVNYATANLTASAGSDYASTSGTLTFNPGDTSKTINVPITNDSSVEGNETFTVNLSSPSKASLGAKVIHTYTISDDDNYGTMELSASSYSVNENGGTVTITATRTGGSSGAVGVSYATSNGTAIAGSDYTATSSTLSWTDGDAANKTITVSVTNDTLNEANETFMVTLMNPMGGATLGSTISATVTIMDDDSNGPIVLNMIKNPDFEEGHVYWSEYSREGYELISEEPLYTFNGNWMAILGGSTRRSYLYQDVKIPTDAISASLDFWFNIVSEESPNEAYDIMKLEVRGPSDNVLLSMLDTLSNLDVTGGWAQSRAYDLMPFRGQDIRLRFKAKNGPANATAFYLDDLAITVSRKINLDAPNGGEIIAAGSIYDIQFRTVSEVSTVKIKYTLNDGRTWKTIAAGETGTSYPWPVPVPARTKTKCKIKVIGYDANGNKIGKDDSDETFTIVR